MKTNCSLKMVADLMSTFFVLGPLRVKNKDKI